jgi:hypothetical protein
MDGEERGELENNDRSDAAASARDETTAARTVIAREVLLDALEALRAHQPAIILVGAQAVYLHTRAVDLSVAAYTFDGDLVVDPRLLRDAPLIEQMMRAAGFVPSIRGNAVEPGVWVTSRRAGTEEVLVPVDLIVPKAFATSRGRRSVSVGAHDKMSLRWAHGLEAAVVDHMSMPIRALDPNDSRSFEVEVAGPAALLVAKLHKLHDRLQPGGRVDRLHDKDASDIYRLMQTFPAGQVARTLLSLESHPLAGAATREAVAYLGELFVAQRSAGTSMAADALEAAIPAPQVRVVATVWTRAVLEELRRLSS